MGYSFATFLWLEGLVERGARVLDLGSQDIVFNSNAEVIEVNKFIARGGGKPIAVHSFPQVVPVAAIWSEAGYPHSCIDVDDRRGTIRVDLQGCEYPSDLKYGFDLVVNAGTTEHLANPAGGLAFAHYACRKGGVMAHDVPLFGYMNHALVNPTPKFWTILQVMNGYEVMSADARKVDDVDNDMNFYGDHLDYINGLKDARNITWMVSIAFRKGGSAAFVPPIDAVLPDSDGSLEADLIASSILPLVASGAWTEREANSAINSISKARKGRSVPVKLAAHVVSAINSRLLKARK